MNQNTTAVWSPMVSAPEDEFANFLEFSDLQLDFPFGTGVQDDTELLPGSAGTMDTHMENGIGMMGFGEGNVQQYQQPQIDPSLMHPQTSSSSLDNVHNSSTESLMDVNTRAQIFHEGPKQYQRQHQRQDHYHGQGMVPPTPNSIEMHGDYSRFYHQVDPHSQANYEQYPRKHQNQVR